MITVFSRVLSRKLRRKSKDLTQDLAVRRSSSGQLADSQSQQGQAIQFVPRWENNRKGE